MKSITKHYHETEDGAELEVPFKPDEFLKEEKVGDKYVVAYLDRDELPGDPFVEFDEGEFFQFNPRKIHDVDRPSPESFKETLRQYPRRVFYIDEFTDSYKVSHRATIKNSEDIEEADGYYVVPDDVPANRRESYAKGVMKTYSAWCQGDVWGIIVWVFTDGICDRDIEVWGYYGYDSAEAECLSEFDRTVKWLKEFEPILVEELK